MDRSKSKTYLHRCRVCGHTNTYVIESHNVHCICAWCGTSRSVLYLQSVGTEVKKEKRSFSGSLKAFRDSVRKFEEVISRLYKTIHR